jgi:1,4-dihydroxy-2-naphthoyl-CoA synthase
MKFKCVDNKNVEEQIYKGKVYDGKRKLSMGTVYVEVQREDMDEIGAYTTNRFEVVEE